MKVEQTVDSFGKQLSVARDVVLLIPLIHIFLSFAYLFFYFEGFGKGLSIFTSPTDVFSVSFSDVAPIYVYSGIGIAIGLLTATNTGIRLPAELDANPVKRMIQIAVSNPPNAVIVLSMLFLLISSVYSAIAFYHITGFHFYSGITIATAILWVLIERKVSSKFSIEKNYANALYCGGFVLLMTILHGLSDAQYDQSREFSNLEKGYSLCGNKLVINRLSDYYLAVTKENERVLIDEDCKTNFVILSKQEFRAYPERLRMIDIILHPSKLEKR